MRSRTRGFGIIEVVIAIALLGLAALGFSQFLMNASKGQKNVQNSVDFDILKTNINLVLGSRSCDGAFQTSAGTPVVLTLPAGKTWSTLTTSPVTHVLSPSAPLRIDQIRQNATIIAQNGTSIGGMRLSKLEFVEATYEGEQSVTDTSTPPVTTTYKVFSVQLLIEATKQLNSYGAPVLSTTLGTKIMVNPSGAANTGRIERCSGTGSASVKIVETSSVGIAPLFATNYGQISIPHTLGKVPKEVRWVLVAQVPNNGYEAGEEVDLLAPGNLTYRSATDTTVYLTNYNAAGGWIPKKLVGSYGYFTPTAGNWNIKAYIISD
jgi:prepilin-type N-terminal cleavage/methylation domain-containing protein